MAIGVVFGAGCWLWWGEISKAGGGNWTKKRVARAVSRSATQGQAGNLEEIEFWLLINVR